MTILIAVYSQLFDCGFFFTPGGDPWIDPLTAAPNKVQDYVAEWVD